LNHQPVLLHVYPARGVGWGGVGVRRAVKHNKKKRVERAKSGKLLLLLLHPNTNLASTVEWMLCSSTFVSALLIDWRMFCAADENEAVPVQRTSLRAHDHPSLFRTTEPRSA
jgi:hypothetical protein